MPGSTAHPVACQIDFYKLGAASPTADRFACHLALMAWERQQKIYIIAATSASINQLDELLWEQPQGRFLPHAVSGDPETDKAPITIGPLSELKPTDVVINLGPEIVPQAERFKRVLEIVPHAEGERKASRAKYKSYRDLGLKPCAHETKIFTKPAD